MKTLCLLCIVPFLVAGLCSSRESTHQTLPEISENTIEETLTFLTQAPHPLGSSNQEKMRDGLIERLKKFNFSTEVDSFSAETPNPVLLKSPSAPAAATFKKNGFNLYARQKKEKCIVALASHYDTKHFENFPYVGANDSGSSTAALVAIAEILSKRPPKSACGIELWFFDGEEAVLADWYSGQTIHPAKIQDNTYGSRHLAGQLQPCGTGKMCRGDQQIVAVILLDMIGSRNLKLTIDANSTPNLISRVLEFAEESRLTDLFSRRKSPVEDDHVPFIKKSIPAIDLIDFNNLDFWHQPGDIHSTISVSNIRKVSQLALTLANDLAAKP